MTDHEVLFTRHNPRHWREFTVLWDERRAAFNVVIRDLKDGLSWWLSVEDARNFAAALQRKLEALDLEALPPPVASASAPAPAASNMPPWLDVDKDD